MTFEKSKKSAEKMKIRSVIIQMKTDMGQKEFEDWARKLIRDVSAEQTANESRIVTIKKFKEKTRDVLRNWNGIMAKEALSDIFEGLIEK